MKKFPPRFSRFKKKKKKKERKKEEKKKKCLRNTKRAEPKEKKYTPLSVKAHPVAVGAGGEGQRRCEKADRGKRSRMNAAGRFGMDFQRR